MLKRVGLGVKIALSMGIVLVLLAAVSFMAWDTIRGSSKGFTAYRGLAKKTTLSSQIQTEMLKTGTQVNEFIITGSNKNLEKYEQELAQIKSYLNEALGLFTDQERLAKSQEIQSQIAAYDAGFKKIVAYKAQRDQKVNDVLVVQGALMEKTLTELSQSAEKVYDMQAAYTTMRAMRNLMLARMYMANFLNSNAQEDVDLFTAEITEYQKMLDELNTQIGNPERKKMVQTAIDANKIYSQTFAEVAQIIAERNKTVEETLAQVGPKIAQAAQNLNDSLNVEQDSLGPQLQAENQHALKIILIVSAIALLFGVLISLLLTRAITGPLKSMFQGLKTLSAGELAEVREKFAEIIAGLRAGSDQVASASLNIAEGANEQASSIEETTASLEEIASMTRQNADHSNEANSNMIEANKIVSEASNSMNHLTLSMEEISKASNETSKIIKTIDEIAFQTNLLALNAAVEAARAGEAGAGFAVVADEVRNLAMRAAEAAKNTSHLIEDTTKKVKDGMELVTKTSEAFSGVASSSGKVGDLVSEIAAASNEQAQGIEQISQGVNQMDKVVQSNVAGTEQLSAQAQELSEYVGMLLSIVEGDKNGQNALQGADQHPSAIEHQSKSPVKALPGHAPKGAAKSGNGKSRGGKEVSPEQVIPLQDDFQDF